MIGVFEYYLVDIFCRKYQNVVIAPVAVAMGAVSPVAVVIMVEIRERFLMQNCKKI